MQVSPQDSGSSAGSATGQQQQSSGAATGEAGDAAGGRPTSNFPRPSPRKAQGWMGRGGIAAVGDSIGNVAPRIMHQDVFMDFPDDFGPPSST